VTFFVGGDGVALYANYLGYALGFWHDDCVGKKQMASILRFCYGRLQVICKVELFELAAKGF
jgi:hypothetical protein